MQEVGAVKKYCHTTVLVHGLWLEHWRRGMDKVIIFVHLLFSSSIQGIWILLPACKQLLKTNKRAYWRWFLSSFSKRLGKNWRFAPNFDSPCRELARFARKIISFCLKMLALLACLIHYLCSFFVNIYI